MNLLIVIYTGIVRWTLRWVDDNMRPRYRSVDRYSRLQDAREVVGFFVLAGIVARFGGTGVRPGHHAAGLDLFAFVGAAPFAPFVKAPIALCATVFCTAMLSIRRRINTRAVIGPVKVSAIFTTLILVWYIVFRANLPALNASAADPNSSAKPIFIFYGLLAIFVALLPAVWKAAYLGMRYSFRVGEVDKRLPAYVAIVAALWELVSALRAVTTSGADGLLVTSGPMILRAVATFSGPLLLLALCSYELIQRRLDEEAVPSPQ